MNVYKVGDIVLWPPASGYDYGPLDQPGCIVEVYAHKYPYMIKYSVMFIDGTVSVLFNSEIQLIERHATHVSPTDG